MASASFTRDEVILALDVLYSAEKGRVSADSDEIKELSQLLNRLPIHPKSEIKRGFRSPAGICQQLSVFKKSIKVGKRHSQIGSVFFEVAFEYEDRWAYLQSIAKAIRKNEAAFVSQFGATLEDEGFPEGVLLGHLHRLIERRDGVRVDTKDRCEICSIQPDTCYHNSGQLLQNHLVVAPTLMDYTKKYGADSFLTVCPTCHTALHRYRPWLTKENCGDILS